MGQLIIAANYGIGVTSDEVTATRNDVIKGKTALTSDSDDEIIDGTLELTGTAGDYDVLDGKTFYSTDPKVKKTGRMPNNGTDVEAYGCSVKGDRFYYDIPWGCYDNPGDDPKVYAMEYNVAHEIGLSEDKILSGNTILGVSGSYVKPVLEVFSLPINMLITLNGYEKSYQIPNFPQGNHMVCYVNFNLYAQNADGTNKNSYDNFGLLSIIGRTNTASFSNNGTPFSIVHDGDGEIFIRSSKNLTVGSVGGYCDVAYITDWIDVND